MKGIYKKISVGVLAAALLVGSGGISQGVQAFANSKYIEFNNDKEDLKKADDLDFKEFKEGKYGFSEFYDRERDRMFSVRRALDSGLQIKEVRDNHNFKADISFKDGWEFKVKKICEESIKLKRRNVNVNVGSLHFIIEI